MKFSISKFSKDFRSNPLRFAPWVRYGIQLAVLVMAVLLPAGIFHLLCPFGGFETLGRFIEQGNFIAKTGLLNLILLGLVLLSALVAGPVFCGWLCPLGAVQEWINKLSLTIRRRLGLAQGMLRINARLDTALSFLRFVILGLIIFKTTEMLSLVFMNADPYYALLNFLTGDVAPMALLILGTVIVASAFVERPWCRWFCPLGGVLSVLGKFSPFKIRRKAAACISCNLCNKACPVGLKPAAIPVVNDQRCIHCGVCSAACPRPQALKPRWLYVAVALVLLAGFIVLPLLFGANTSATNFGDRAHQQHSTPAATADASHTAAGNGSGDSGNATMRPAINITGSMTLAQLGESLETNPFDLLGIPADTAGTTKLRDLEDSFPDKTLPWIRSTVASWQAANP